MVGAPVDPHVAELLAGRGLVSDGSRARQLDRAALHRAALVVVMSRAQRAAVVSVEPSAVRRTVLLGRLGRQLSRAGSGLPGATPAERLDALPGWLARARTAGPAAADDEIGDPYGRAGSVHTEVFGRIEDAIGLFGRALVPETGGSA